METEVSLMCFQEVGTGPYPGSGHSSPQPFVLSFKIYFNIFFLPLAPCFTKWSGPFRYFHQNVVYISVPSHSRCMFRPSHVHWLNRLNKIWRKIQITKLLIIKYLSSLLSRCTAVVRTCSSALRFQTRVVYVFLEMRKIIHIKPTATPQSQVLEPYRLKVNII